jgi:hypothetical protein
VPLFGVCKFRPFITQDRMSREDNYIWIGNKVLVSAAPVFFKRGWVVAYITEIDYDNKEVTINIGFTKWDHIKITDIQRFNTTTAKTINPFNCSLWVQHMASTISKTDKTKQCIACKMYLDSTNIENHGLCLACASKVDLVDIDDLTPEQLGSAVRVKLGIGLGADRIVDTYTEGIQSTIACSDQVQEKMDLSFKQEQAIQTDVHRAIASFEYAIKKFDKPKQVKGSTDQELQLAESCRTGCSIVHEKFRLKCTHCLPDTITEKDDYRCWGCPAALSKCASQILKAYTCDRKIGFYTLFYSLSPQQQSSIRADIVSDLRAFMELVQQQCV